LGPAIYRAAARRSGTAARRLPRLPSPLWLPEQHAHALGSSFRLSAVAPLGGSAAGDAGPEESIADLKYLEEAFIELQRKGSKNKVSFSSFLEWEEIQALLTDEQTTVDELQKLWTSAGGVESTNDGLNFNNFVAINRALDDLFEYEDEEEYGEGEGEGDDEEMEGFEGLDVWSRDLDPTEVLEPEFVTHLKRFYDAHASKSPPFGLSYSVFSTWDEVRQMLSQGEVDVACLEELWAETLFETAKNFPELAKQTQNNIDFDTFLRLNIRLEQILDELQEALESLSDEDVEAYYRKEFASLTQRSGGDLLSYKDLMEWPDMQEMLQHGVLKQDDVDRMWNALPKQNLGAFYKKKGFGVQQSDGINVEAFLALNQAIEDEGESEVVGGADDEMQ